MPFANLATAIVPKSDSGENQNSNQIDESTGSGLIPVRAIYVSSALA